MPDRPPPPKPPKPREPALAETVDSKAARKLAARQQKHGMWHVLGMMGLVGWSVVAPTLAGAAIGYALDRHELGAHSWTLALLVAGLVLGCWNAWRWIEKEDRLINIDKDKTDE